MAESLSLAQHAAQSLHASFPEAAREALSVEDVTDLLAPPPKADMGDLAFPCFRLAKALRNAPPKIAAELVDGLKAKIDAGEAGILGDATTAGPYLNLRFDLAKAAALVLPAWARGEAPTPAPKGEKVMVEYSQPNTHKAFHVGHLRNVCLGDALVRLYRAAGYEVVAANYLGDVGTHIAKCLWGYTNLLTDEERVAPETGKGEWLGEVYAKSSDTLATWEEAAKGGDADAQAKVDAAKAEMTRILKAVEERDEELTKLWTETRQWSLDEFDEIYEWCGVHFDRIFFESEVDQPSLALVDEYLEKGVFVESDGAIGIENPEIKHMPFFMLRKRDGTGLYSTKDLALARMKFDEFNVDRSIYVVDVRQSDHFRQVFLTLKKMGFEQAEKCVHVPYEMVELPDGGMSSRKGNVVLFRALREQLRETILNDKLKPRYAETWTEAELEETAKLVSLGAIKFGMLERDVNQKIIFDMKEWTEFEGKTGPYLQYVTARTAPILRRSADEGHPLDESHVADAEAFAKIAGALEHASERQMINLVAGLPAVVMQAAESNRPSSLVTYLYGLTKAFNEFYRDCSIKAAEGDLKQARLVVVKAAREALAWGLDLLGIPAPERM
jgi:arginyl-tRNA synthetase